MTIPRNFIVTVFSLALLSAGTNCSGPGPATPTQQVQVETDTQESGTGGIIPIMGSTSNTSPLCIAPWMVTGGSRCGGVASGIFFPSTGKLVALVVVLVENSPSGGRVYVLVNGAVTALSADVPLSRSEPVLVRENVSINPGDKVEIATTSATGQPFAFNATLEYQTYGFGP